MSQVYTAIPLDEGYKATPRQRGTSYNSSTAKKALCALLAAVAIFLVGVVAGRDWSDNLVVSRHQPDVHGLLPQQAFIPDIPTRPVIFEFPTKYEDTGPDGDRLWDKLMPIGAGFIRVPFPRRFMMPDSEPIQDDAEEGEVYSLSATHQLHCLAVLRDVIVKYEKRDKSRFAGDGHEYHCLDYIRQAILCGGDTTLDYANDRTFGQDGKVTRYGFTGANSTHQCRDWDAIKAFAEQHKSGNRTGILV